MDGALERNLEQAIDDLRALNTRVDRIELLLNKTVLAVMDLAHETARLFQETNEQIRLLAEAQQRTDKRWAELIDQLNREHGNGHGEQQ